MCVENSKLFLSVVGKNMELLETKNRLERKVRELDVLVEIANVAAASGKLDDMLQGVLGRAMRAIDAEAGSILLSDEHTGDLRFRCAMGGAPEAVKRVRIKAGEGICGWVATHGEPQIVNDVRRDKRHSRVLEDDIGYHPRSVHVCAAALGRRRGRARAAQQVARRRPTSPRTTSSWRRSSPATSRAPSAWRVRASGKSAKSG